jgi:hypothetical protein
MLFFEAEQLSISIKLLPLILTFGGACLSFMIYNTIEKS